MRVPDRAPLETQPPTGEGPPGPDACETHRPIGGEGDWAGAELQLREALSLDPVEAYWHGTLAKLLHEEGDTGEAAAECVRAAALSLEDLDLARGKAGQLARLYQLTPSKGERE
jgi:hypothetical protein